MTTYQASNLGSGQPANISGQGLYIYDDGTGQWCVRIVGVNRRVPWYLAARIDVTGLGFTHVESESYESPMDHFKLSDDRKTLWILNVLGLGVDITRFRFTGSRLSFQLQGYDPAPGQRGNLVRVTPSSMVSVGTTVVEHPGAPFQIAF